MEKEFLDFFLVASCCVT